MTTQPGMMGMGMSVIPGSQPVVWMTRPQPIPGCPAGLEYLTSIDQLLVKQQRELLESETVTYSFIHSFILFFSLCKTTLFVLHIHFCHGSYVNFRKRNTVLSFDGAVVE